MIMITVAIINHNFKMEKFCYFSFHSNACRNITTVCGSQTFQKTDTSLNLQLNLTCCQPLWKVSYSSYHVIVALRTASLSASVLAQEYILFKKQFILETVSYTLFKILEMSYA